MKFVNPSRVVYGPVLGCGIVAERNLWRERCELVCLDRPCLRDFSKALQGIQIVTARLDAQTSENLAVEGLEDRRARGFDLPR